MGKRFFQKTLSTVLWLTTIAASIPHAWAGTGQSKPKLYFSPKQQSIISNPKYLPYYAEDGGRAYFNAWNSINDGNDFMVFTKKCSHIIENRRSATELKDSAKSDSWSTGPVYGCSFAVERLSEYPPNEYFLRTDYKSKIVYTIRKSNHTYLCAFYILNVNPENEDEVIANLAYQFVLSSENNSKKLLLPIDKKLLDESHKDL